MNKKKFIAIMKEWEEIERAIEGVDAALDKLNPDFNGFSMSRYSNLVGGLLKEITSDESDWISYFVYELEWGKKWKKGTVVGKDKKDIPLGDYDDLWEILNNK